MKRKIVQDYDIKIRKMTQEKENIIKTMAKFGYFLKQNSVMTYNDATMAYFNLMIKEEKDKMQINGDSSKVERLLELKQRYDEELKIIQKAVDDNDEETIVEYGDLDDQEAAMYDLFDMELFGKNLRQLFDDIDKNGQETVDFKENHYAIKKKQQSWLSNVNLSKPIIYIYLKFKSWAMPDSVQTQRETKRNIEDDQSYAKVAGKMSHGQNRNQRKNKPWRN